MRRIFIFCVLFALLLSGVCFLDAHTLSGIVKDSQGNPIYKVSVTVKGSRIATTTNVRGEYSLTVTDEKAHLIFRAAGYQQQEVDIAGRSQINIVLIAAEQKLEEVVVAGYALQGQVKGLVVKKDMLSRPPAASIQDIKIRNDGVSDTIDYNTEEYDRIEENPFQKTADHPLSTFSIDVDVASYSNIRRYLNESQLPPAGAVRIEEMINYFHYEYPQPEEGPFSINSEIANCPWNKNHRIVLLGLQGKKIPAESLPASNLVFLIDVSGSMDMPNKLPLVQQSLRLLTDQLRAQDKVAIVVYAGNAGLVLPATSGLQKQKIKDAISQLEAGGSTAGGAGIKLAYKIAKDNFVQKGNNRVILCTDGDFNVGVSSDDEMERLIEKERESGVFLTVLGYGMGNYKDSKMQKLADRGNGNHAYIDSENEAKKVLVNEFGGTLFTIAKDVKLQVEFNPAKVQGYRLIGYENRILNKEDFNDDKKDAGELGSGHTVTALYEIIPAGEKSSFLKDVDPLKYQASNKYNDNPTNDLLTVKFRYKAPNSDRSSLIVKSVIDQNFPFEKGSNNLQFATCVAEFGMLLRNSHFKQNASYAHLLNLASKAIGTDEEGYRKEFLKLVRKAAILKKVEQNEDKASDSGQ